MHIETNSTYINWEKGVKLILGNGTISSSEQLTFWKTSNPLSKTISRSLLKGTRELHWSCLCVDFRHHCSIASIMDEIQTLVQRCCDRSGVRLEDVANYCLFEKPNMILVKPIMSDKTDRIKLAAIKFLNQPHERCEYFWVDNTTWIIAYISHESIFKKRWMTFIWSWRRFRWNTECLKLRVIRRSTQPLALELNCEPLK